MTYATDPDVLLWSKTISMHLTPAWPLVISGYRIDYFRPHSASEAHPNRAPCTGLKTFGNHSLDPSTFASGLVPLPISILLPLNLTPGVIYLIPNQVVQPLLDLQPNPPAQPTNLSTSSDATLVAVSHDESPDSGKAGRQEWYYSFVCVCLSSIGCHTVGPNRAKIWHGRPHLPLGGYTKHFVQVLLPPGQGTMVRNAIIGATMGKNETL